MLGVRLGVTSLGRPSSFDLGSLFLGGQQGLLYRPSPSTTFTDTLGTAPASVGEAVARLNDESGNDNHATQGTVDARPTLVDAPARLTIDKVDDVLTVTVPSGGFEGVMILSTDAGTGAYGVNIPAGDYDVGGVFFPGDAIVAVIIRDGAMSQSEINAAVSYCRNTLGGGGDYSAATDFLNYWRGRSELTSFPAFDLSNAERFKSAWFGCSGLTSFPLVDVSLGLNFGDAWLDCSGLTSFPLLDVSRGTLFNGAWFGCSGLTSFPLLNTSSGENFSYAWQGCSGLTDFPLIDVSGALNIRDAWRNCTSLQNFPANFFDGCAATDFFFAFENTNLTQTSIDNILVSIDSNGTSGGTFTQTGGSAPSAAGEAAIDAMRGRGWTIAVTGGY